MRKIWKEKDVHKAVVQGSRRYDVRVTVDDEGNIEASCTCPYEGEGICKHTVAAILAFAQNPKLAEVELPFQKNTKLQDIEKLIKRANDTQIRKFLRQLLEKDGRLIHDFGIFLQGPKETSATVQSYKARIIKKLDELDLDELEEAWYNSGDDYYDFHPEYRNNEGYDEETLGKIAKPFLDEAQKYGDNQNYAESGKIFQAIIDAFLEKESEVAKNHEDVADWFFDEAEVALKLYYSVLAPTTDQGIKKVGLEYLCRLFGNKQFEYLEHQGGIEKGLEEAVKNKTEAQICLHVLATIIEKKKLSVPESSLLAFLYSITGDNDKFEEISLDNLRENPGLVLNLLKFYQKLDRKLDILKIAGAVLARFDGTGTMLDWNYCSEGLEIEISEFLKGVLDIKTEYPQSIKNLERLFLKSKKISDYKELAKIYKSNAEKEEFLTRMKKVFGEENEIEIMFQVFELENKKEEILGLTGKYKDAACFPDMIAAISKIYPPESFANYKKKIEHLLLEANVKVYPAVVYHLKQMRKIGFNQGFKNFVDWIAITYSRRRNLMDEMKNGRLI